MLTIPFPSNGSKETPIVTSDKTNPKVLIDRDRLMNADSQEVARLCARIFHTVQSQRPELQLLGLASAFIILSETTRIPAQDVFTAVRNLMYDPIHSSGRKHQFDAMRFYMKEDVLER